MQAWLALFADEEGSSYTCTSAENEAAKLPVDEAVPEALFRASVKGDPALADPVHREMEVVCARRAPGHKVVALAGPDFYARVKAAHAIVATSEPRLFANIIIRKGVIHPPETETT